MEVAILCILSLCAYLGKTCFQEVRNHFLAIVGLRIAHSNCSGALGPRARHCWGLYKPFTVQLLPQGQPNSCFDSGSPTAQLWLMPLRIDPGYIFCKRSLVPVAGKVMLLNVRCSFYSGPGNVLWALRRRHKPQINKQAPRSWHLSGPLTCSP